MVFITNPHCRKVKNESVMFSKMAGYLNELAGYDRKDVEQVKVRVNLTNCLFMSLKHNRPL